MSEFFDVANTGKATITDSALFDTDDVRFHFNLEAQVQFVLHVKVKDEVSFPIVRMVAKKDMYKKGLQYNHKEKVNIQLMADSLKNLLTSLANTGKFGEDRYNAIIAIHKDYIETHMGYSSLVDRVRIAQSKDGWV